MGFWDNVGKTISDASQEVIQKGKDMADVAKYNSLITEEEKKITSIYEQIGKKYVDEYGESPANLFAEYIEALKISQDKISEYQQKLKNLKGVTKCLSCGAEVPNGSLFCVVCGAKITAPESITREDIHCTGCGALIPKGSKFCTSCGKPIEDVKNNTNAQGEGEE